MKYPGIKYQCPTCSHSGRIYPDITYNPQVSFLKEKPKTANEIYVEAQKELEEADEAYHNVYSIRQSNFQCTSGFGTVGIYGKYCKATPHQEVLIKKYSAESSRHRTRYKRLMDKLEWDSEAKEYILKTERGGKSYPEVKYKPSSYLKEPERVSTIAPTGVEGEYRLDRPAVPVTQPLVPAIELATEPIEVSTKRTVDRWFKTGKAKQIQYADAKYPPLILIDNKVYRRRGGFSFQPALPEHLSPEVLADYPDLAKAVPKPPVVTPVTPEVTIPDITREQIMIGEGVDAVTARKLANGTFMVTPSYNQVSKGFERKVFNTQEEAKAYINELQTVKPTAIPKAKIVAPPVVTPVAPEVTKLTGDIWERMTPVERENLRVKAKLEASKHWDGYFGEEKRALIREYKKEQAAIPKAEAAPPVAPEVIGRFDKAVDLLQGGATFDEIVKSKVLTIPEAERLHFIYQRVESNRHLLGLKTNKEVKMQVISDLQDSISAAERETTIYRIPKRRGKSYPEVKYKPIKYLKEAVAETECQIISPQYYDTLGWLNIPVPDYSFAIEPEVKERKIDEVLQKLKDGVATIHDSAIFREFLTTMSKFWEYSIGNQILIMLQKPGATRVAGFVTWKELGRWVTSGPGSGIAILAPCLPPKGERYILWDRRMQSSLGSFATREEAEDYANKHLVKQWREWVEIRETEEVPTPTYFKVVYVFDVSQTEGKPLPEIAVPVLSGAFNKELYDKLMALASKHSLAVSFEPRPELDPSIKGMLLGKDIWVKPDEPEAQRLKTLAHEEAHYFTEHVYSIPRAEAEVTAESVAFVVCAHYGFDTGTRSFPYVALWAKEKKVLEQNLASIRKISGRMIEELGA